MTSQRSRLRRREFLRLLGLNFAALAMPQVLTPGGRPALLNPYQDEEYLAKALAGKTRFPRLRLAQLPDYPAHVLSLVPRLHLDQAGYLVHASRSSRFDNRSTAQRLPLLPTEWNQNNSADYDRLLADYNWAIVIHWFGNTEENLDTVDAFLRGFNGLRSVAGRETRTSAHFLVGAESVDSPEQGRVAILQTQKPGPAGIPYLASHLYYIDSADLKERNYFVRAMDDLSRKQAGVHSTLQDIFARPQIDPNYYTLSIEMDGYDFDGDQHLPPEQQIANLVGLVWALMERYQLPASAVIGHNEIDLRKNDPGKKFMALMRYLLGLKALVDGNQAMCQLVFGQHLSASENVMGAIEAYFQFLRDYLARIALPVQVFEWENLTSFWQVADSLAGRSTTYRLAHYALPPSGQSFIQRGSSFLKPGSHEGFDLYTTREAGNFKHPVEQAVKLAFQGECVYSGAGGGCGNGSATVFRHRHPFGGEFISIFNHLTSLNEIKVGRVYPLGFSIGSVRGSGQADDGYLHLALAYSTTWELDLQGKPYPPFGVPESWLRSRFISPVEFFNSYPTLPG